MFWYLLTGNQSNNSNQSVILQGCSVKLERQYIEVDEEIVSITTDIDGLYKLQFILLI